MEVCVKLSNGPSYVDVDGVRVHSGYSPEAVRSALLYEPSPEDVFVVTYPKAGTTWVQQIGYLIFNKGVPACNALEFLRSSPFLEMSGATVMKQWTRRGFIKTHLPYSLLRKHSRAKYIYVCRNPKDVCISLFHHTRLFNAYEFADGKFEDFFEAFLKGNTDYGDYFDHLLSWYKHRNDPNVLFLHYEEIKLNLRQCVVKIAKFMGEEHLELLLNNEAILENVLRYSGIEYMRVVNREGPPRPSCTKKHASKFNACMTEKVYAIPLSCGARMSGVPFQLATAGVPASKCTKGTT
ncbi:hypothetical protein HPB47_019425 [Ixodes persulcatus]|uniref:Uncharacterized protein n=1 Tax=Ixodes persulcatus TaxID=34615 RepID=A0AC60QLR3_IXOPE|nr:hypothetical protein HPB47_019425 [Ixodes persulcatus]